MRSPIPYQNNALRPPTTVFSGLSQDFTFACYPLIVTDAGFKVPWYKEVEAHGWFWLSRIRGTVQFADIGAENWRAVRST